MTTTLRCAGRPVDHHTNQPHGDPCGREYPRRPATTDGEYHQQGRARGWRIGHLPDGTPTAICNRCAKPDPVTLAHCRDLQRSIG